MSQLSKKASQSKLSQTSCTDEVTDEIVNAAVKAILTLDHSKRPIKQLDVVNSLYMKLKRKQLEELWGRVQEKLNSIGMKLVECANSQSKSFFLVCERKDLKNGYLFSPQEEKADRTLLVLILAFIFMKDGMATEAELFRHLQGLQILESNHEYFGDVKKKITVQFVDQKYLVRTPTPESDVIELKWGQRAELEISTMDILKFVCKVGYDGNVRPEDWVSQFNRVGEDETALESQSEN